MEIFNLQNLTFTYPQQSQPVLKDISFCVEPGEFVVLAGPSGCGKSTLLRQLKTVLAPHGQVEGQLLFHGQPLSQVPLKEQTAKIGFVQQSPDNQIVTDKVWHELAFGLESLGYDTPTIRSRVAEMASFFGIQTWFYKNVSELSGGQKQLLNLAAIMAMHPSALVLDEPTSQLDPIAATDFLSTLGRINRELGTTVLITEHRLEEVFPLCSRVVVMDQGSVLCNDTPQKVGTYLKDRGHAMFLAMPAPMRIWSAVENDLDCPVTVREGRTWLDAFSQERPLQPISPAAPKDFSKQKTAVSMQEVWFRYEKDSPDVVKGLTFQAHYGELFCILGGNGTGKTTTLSLLTGVHKPYRGKLILEQNSLAALPQNPQSLFVKNSVYEDLLEMLSGMGLSREEKQRRIQGVAGLCQIMPLMQRHPYDLSGGEQQRAALAKVLLLQPKILLLDEPTKGVDAEFKQTFASIVRGLLNSGVCVIMVSHDVEFCAQYADRCALFFDGSIVSENAPVQFFSGKNFYTTASNRMARQLLPEAVTVNDVIVACGGTPMQEKAPQDATAFLEKLPQAQGLPVQQTTQKKLPKWRAVLAAISGLAALGIFIYTLCNVNLTELFTNDNFKQASGNYTGIYGALLASLVIFALAITQKSGPAQRISTRQTKGKLSKRTLAAAIMIVLAIPLTIFVGYYFFGDRKYYFISLLIILETMLPFVLVFESRKPQARELVIIAVLCALGIVGRAAFAALPGFKPVAAIVIIAGVAFGGETGFLVGAMTMFGSNMLFGQGPWTPWQMFAMGLIGFLAGVLFRKGVLRRSRLSLCIYGALSAIVLYGGLMNPASVLMYQSRPNLAMFLTAYLTGFPADLLHGAAVVLFLWVLSQPLLEKLDRIKVKYGLIE